MVPQELENIHCFDFDISLLKNSLWFLKNSGDIHFIDFDLTALPLECRPAPQSVSFMLEKVDNFTLLICCATQIKIM